jgi:mRNA-degrading endonuclease RelE of RelBE toxin-antitoxin system
LYAIGNSERIDKIFCKHSRKSPQELEAITKKLIELAEDQHRFKPLSNVMKSFRRMHFGSFVLIFSIDEQRMTVVLEGYQHHDIAYRN